MHAGIVMLILLWAVGVTPSAKACLEMQKYVKSVDGWDVTLAALYGLFWPFSLIATLVCLLRSKKKTEVV